MSDATEFSRLVARLRSSAIREGRAGLRKSQSTEEGETDAAEVALHAFRIAELARVRNEALEEAAQIAESKIGVYDPWITTVEMEAIDSEDRDIAAAIRALKDKK